jgi:hypothetical protein
MKLHYITSKAYNIFMRKRMEGNKMLDFLLAGILIVIFSLLGPFIKWCENQIEK